MIKGVLFLVCLSFWHAGNAPTDINKVVDNMDIARIVIASEKPTHFQIYEINFDSGTVKFVCGCK